MPAESKAQQEFMAIQLKKAEKGEAHKVSEKVAREFATTKRKNLPERITKRGR
jgi:hypothetical protein